MMKQIWAQEQVKNDKNFKAAFKELVEPAGYEVSEFGDFSMYSPITEYARVEITSFQAKVSTTSSHWTTDEANVMMEEMQQSILLASKINILVSKYQKQYERIFVQTDPLGSKK